MRCKPYVLTLVLLSSISPRLAAADAAVPYKDTLMFVDWWVQAEPVYLKTIESALKDFTSFVRANEPGTLIYLIYTPRSPSQPPAGTSQIRFVESYIDEEAFKLHLRHFDEQIRNRFGGLFVAAPNSPLNPFLQVENASRYRATTISPPAGYIRPGGPHRAAITQNVRWWLKPTADRAQVLKDLAEFAAWCEDHEPGTLIYLFSLPEAGLVWPPANPGEILFMAAYESQAAFTFHVDNWNQRFLSHHIDDFVSSPDGGYPFIQVLDLELFDGFSRPDLTMGGKAR